MSEYSEKANGEAGKGREVEEEDEEEVIILKKVSNLSPEAKPRYFDLKGASLDKNEVMEIDREEITEEEGHSDSRMSEEEQSSQISAMDESDGDEEEESPAQWMKKRHRYRADMENSGSDEEEENKKVKKLAEVKFTSARSSMAPMRGKKEEEEEEEPKPKMMRAVTSVGGQAKAWSSAWNFLAPQRRADAPKKKESTKSNSILIRRAEYDREKKEWRVLELPRGETREELLVPDGKMVLEIRHGDLTGEAVDVVVNAANSYLKHGGGVAGALSSKGGSEVQRESDAWTKLHGPVNVGDVAYTRAGHLAASWIVHAVGPIYEASKQALQEDQLYMAVFRSLSLADSSPLSASSISIPAISSGIFGFPKKDVARSIVSAALDFIEGPRLSDADYFASLPVARRRPPIEISQLVFDRSDQPTNTLKLIRLVNFDLPTVSVFSDQFDDFFSP